MSVRFRPRRHAGGGAPGAPLAAATEEPVVAAPAPTDPPAAAGPSAPPQESLAVRYARMAHEGFEPRAGDLALRALDLAISAAALIALSPLVGLISAGVYLNSGGPVLYRGRRVGRAGEIFTMYKFRTLTPDAETRLGPYLGSELTRLTEDEVTRVGRWLRATHFDEIPQLWNVLRGDMSIVGPRPIRPAFFEELCEQIPQYWQRLVVPPGITGFAQIRMTREMSWAEKLAHDLEYIADRSLSLYLSVVKDTAARLLRRIVGGE
jgi:lipopolysaccharide/colanic/teichoic acid biosynthesis glycosyltransferase